MNIRRLIKKLVVNQSKQKLVRIYSHPRSGTHFVEAFLAENFYQNQDLGIEEVAWGHWSNRKIKKDGNKYGKLFGNHFFPKLNEDIGPAIYIYRDGRAVSYSVWNTPNFIHGDLVGISFKEFIRTKLDWYGSPSVKGKEEYTVFEHWIKHVQKWKAFALRNNNILIIRYEDLVNNPYQVYLKIHEQFFKNIKLLKKEEINVIDKPVGLLPNKGKIDSWKKMFDKEDLKLYDKYLSDIST